MIRRYAAICCLVPLLGTGAAPQEKKWSEPFPAIAQRVPQLDQRLAAEDVEVRKRVLAVLRFVQMRDSKVYPPFLRGLLDDKSPEIRGLAIEWLWEHNIFLHQEDLPACFDVHFVGEFHWKNPAELARVRLI